MVNLKKNIIISIVSFLLAGIILFIGFVVPLFKNTKPEINDVEFEASIVEVVEEEGDYLITTNEFGCKLFVDSDATIDRELVKDIISGEKIYFRIIKLKDNPFENPQIEQIFVVSLRTETMDIITLESFQNRHAHSINKIKKTCVAMSSALVVVSIINIVLFLKKRK